MKVTTVLAQALLLTACAAIGFADDKPSGQTDYKKLFSQYMEKYGQPGPEHKLLEPLVGTWHAKVKVWIDPNEAPHVSEGTLVRKSVFDGRFVEEKFDGKMMDRPFQGMGVIGYNRAKQQFETGWLDSVSTALMHAHGTYDEATKTFTFKHHEKCPITGKDVKMRDTLQIVNANEEKMEMFRQLGDEKEMKTMEITLTRQK